MFVILPKKEIPTIFPIPNFSKKLCADEFGGSWLSIIFSINKKCLDLFNENNNLSN